VKRTKTIKDNFDPIWNEQFKFNLEDAKKNMLLTVFDEDTFGDRFIGKYELNIKDMIKDNNV